MNAQQTGKADSTAQLPADLRARAKDWVVHLATGTVSEDDLKAFERWRNQSAAHAEAYVQASRLWKALEAPLKSAERSLPRQVVHGLPTLPNMLGRRAFVGGTIAASVAAVGGGLLVRPPLDLWPSLTAFTSDYRTSAGEQRKLSLAADTSIEMNTRTSLNIAAAPSDAQFIDIIEGEAAITAGAQPVQVRAGGGLIAAFNAQFIVRCDHSGVRVTCLAGRVDVSLGGRETGLEVRQQIAYADKLAPVVMVNPAIQASWRDGLLIFENEPIARVIEEINRYRPGRIVLMDAELGKRQVNARFKLARLDSVLTQFREVFGVKVTALGAGIALVG